MFAVHSAPVLLAWIAAYKIINDGRKFVIRDVIISLLVSPSCLTILYCLLEIRAIPDGAVVQKTMSNIGIDPFLTGVLAVIIYLLLNNRFKKHRKMCAYVIIASMTASVIVFFTIPGSPD